MSTTNIVKLYYHAKHLLNLGVSNLNPGFTTSQVPSVASVTSLF